MGFFFLVYICSFDWFRSPSPVRSPTFVSPRFRPQPLKGASASGFLKPPSGGWGQRLCPVLFPTFVSPRIRPQPPEGRAAGAGSGQRLCPVLLPTFVSPGFAPNPLKAGRPVPGFGQRLCPVLLRVKSPAPAARPSGGWGRNRGWGQSGAKLLLHRNGHRRGQRAAATAVGRGEAVGIRRRGQHLVESLHCPCHCPTLRVGSACWAFGSR